MYKTSLSISESELSSSKTKHIFIADTPQCWPYFQTWLLHHQFTTLPSCFLIESYSRLTNIKEQTTAHKAYFFLFIFDAYYFWFDFRSSKKLYHFVNPKAFDFRSF